MRDKEERMVRYKLISANLMKRTRLGPEAVADQIPRAGSLKLPGRRSLELAASAALIQLAFIGRSIKVASTPQGYG